MSIQMEFIVMQSFWTQLGLGKAHMISICYSHAKPGPHNHRTFAHLSESRTPQIRSSSSSCSPDVMLRHCSDPAPSYRPATILPHVPVPVLTHSICSIHPVASLSCILIHPIRVYYIFALPYPHVLYLYSYASYIQSP